MRAPSCEVPSTRTFLRRRWPGSRPLADPRQSRGAAQAWRQAVSGTLCRKLNFHSESNDFVARGVQVPRLFETVADLHGGSEVLRRRRYGMIEAVEGRFLRVVLRPYPKLVSLPEILLLGKWQHGHRPGDWCRLYYNQPGRFGNFLAVQYVVSARDTQYKTFRRVLEALDHIARLKRSDALLCDLANGRISREMMARWGWEPHCPSRWHRHYIKRFYGNYPPPAKWIATPRRCTAV